MAVDFRDRILVDNGRYTPRSVAAYQFGVAVSHVVSVVDSGTPSGPLTLAASEDVLRRSTRLLARLILDQIPTAVVSDLSATWLSGQGASTTLTTAWYLKCELFEDNKVSAAMRRQAPGQAVASERLSVTCSTAAYILDELGLSHVNDVVPV